MTTALQLLHPCGLRGYSASYDELPFRVDLDYLIPDYVPVSALLQ